MYQVPELRAQVHPGAKYFDDPAFLSHVAMLEREFREPKENRVFL